MMTRPSRQPGIGAPEVVVLLAIGAVVGLLVVMALPRYRENARLVGCRRNLGQIGVALGVYHQAVGHWPAVPAFGAAGQSPLRALLGELGVADFRDLTANPPPPARRPDAPGDERPVPGFVCPSDSRAAAGPFPAPISYRATAGSLPEGRDGPFAPGRAVGAAEVEAGDGQAFTAAFAERLLGTGRPGVPAPGNYALVPGPPPSSGCPEAPADAHRGDAGRSWAEATWRSILYNHTLPPNAPRSCVAADGRSALMGASSGHLGAVHVLMLDGSVRPVTPRIDPSPWRRMATIHDPTTP